MYVAGFKPKWKHHATLPPRLVLTAEQEEKLGEGWTDTYQHQPYPSYRYHPTKAPAGKIVKNEEEHKALGEGWYTTPADFPQANPAVERTETDGPTSDGTTRSMTPAPDSAAEVNAGDAKSRTTRRPPPRKPDLETSRRRIDLCNRLLQELATINPELSRFRTPASLKQKHPGFEIWTLLEDTEVLELMKPGSSPRLMPRAVADDGMESKELKLSRPWWLRACPPRGCKAPESHARSSESRCFGS